MGAYISKADLEDLERGMSKESLKVGIFICFIGYIAIRLFIWINLG